MGISVNNIPSINVPFTDQQGRINPIWHEFLRSFVSSTVESTDASASATLNLTAGAGLTGGGTLTEDVTVNVGAGSGITVNADDVNVDIANENYAQASPSDEVLISDVSDNNNLKRTKVSDITDLVDLSGVTAGPAGSDTEVQYNNSGALGANSNFTYDGAGGVTIGTSVSIGSITLEGGAVDYVYFNGVSGSSAARIQADGGGGYTLHGKPSGSDVANMYVSSTNPPYIQFNLQTSTYFKMSSLSGSGDGLQVVGELPFRRNIHENVTASTTQTQGQGQLTGDYNNVTTVANANDTVTMPTALTSRYCLIRNAGANILQVFPSTSDDLGEGTNNPTTIAPGSHKTWFATNATTWHEMDGALRSTNESGITASTTQTQGQQPLTEDVNEISTCANTNDTVTLPTAPSYSRTITVINNGANTLQIFPASGDDLGAGVNTATTLAASGIAQFINYDATNWAQTI